MVTYPYTVRAHVGVCVSDNNRLFNERCCVVSCINYPNTVHVASCMFDTWRRTFKLTRSPVLTPLLCQDFSSF